MVIPESGQTSTLPTFEVKMTAKSNRSRGMYYCKVQLWKISTDSVPTIESDHSNYWNTEPQNPDTRLGNFFNSWGFIAGVSVLGVIIAALIIFGVLKYTGFFGKKHDISKEMFRERDFD